MPAATFIAGSEDCRVAGWTYPQCVSYTVETMAAIAREAGLSFRLLDWRHPRQTRALFGKSGFDTTWFDGPALTWNTMMDRGHPTEGRLNRVVGS